MKISGCTKGPHTDDAPQMEAPKSMSSANLTMTETPAGQEVYTSGLRANNTSTLTAAMAVAPAPPVIEAADDLSVPVKIGTTCQRNGCGVVFESDEKNRIGDGEGTVCTYHPAPPIFREGSKGYLCCKRRVLEFDEFLKIQGCKTGRHVFALKVTDTPAEELVDCRMDHYQTASEVHVSVFAKKVDQECSTVKFDETQIHFDLYLPGSKRFQRTVDLFGPIDTASSSYKYFGTKVEVILKKNDTRSWTLLEKTTRDLGNISLTFGVGGRTGTVGAKTPVIDESNKAR